MNFFNYKPIDSLSPQLLQQDENPEVSVFYRQSRHARSVNKEPRQRFVFGLGKRAEGWNGQENYVDTEEESRDLQELIARLKMFMTGLKRSKMGNILF